MKSFEIKKVDKASYTHEMPFFLSELAYQAKSYWEYPDDWLKSWIPDLQVTNEEILSNSTFILSIENQIQGFLMLLQNQDHLEIDHFWIHPSQIGYGYGKKLFDLTINQLPIPHPPIHALSDPYAEGFYKKMGFDKIKDIESNIDDRTLPLMVLKNY